MNSHKSVRKYMQLEASASEQVQSISYVSGCDVMRTRERSGTELELPSIVGLSLKVLAKAAIAKDMELEQELAYQRSRLVKSAKTFTSRQIFSPNS